MASWNFPYLRCLKNLEWSHWFISKMGVSSKQPNLTLCPKSLFGMTVIYFSHIKSKCQTVVQSM
jgi:hypothetical protein